MKVVILAGGFGTRISEESHLKPKPMLEIGGKPILWHIMKEYSWYGFHEFIICAGYKQHMIKEWFADYYLHSSDITFDFADHGNMTVHNNFAEPWKVTVVDTGQHTMTGGRIKRIQNFVGQEPFFLTYGDGVSDIDLCALLQFHKSHGKTATLTAAAVSQRFGVLGIGNGREVLSFREKKTSDQARVNAGYMVLQPEVFQYIAGDDTVFEKEPLEALVQNGQLMAYIFDGYWQCMDTKREMDQLNRLWDSGQAPWKKWTDRTDPVPGKEGV